MRKAVWILMMLGLLMLSAPGLAQEVEEAPPVADGAIYGGAEATHTINATTRFNMLPDSVLDIWFDLHGSLWDDQANMGFGLEYVYRKVNSFDVVIGVVWTDFSMPSSYWLEEGKNYDAADFTTNSLSTLAIEAKIYGYYNFIKELGIYYGGGIWLAGVLGEMTKASVNAGCALQAQGGNRALSECTHDPTAVPEEDVPPVFGFVNVSLGLRAELEEMFVIKIEAGFQANFYVGFSLGVQFF